MQQRNQSEKFLINVKKSIRPKRDIIQKPHPKWSQWKDAVKTLVPKKESRDEILRYAKQDVDWKYLAKVCFE